ncbi:hemolysin family protein [Vulgatibacter incomptus]|uniref:Magnesium and cobalt efflux protein CorC n=1 Tax=Vulgatibacter incomptus TaxID=1391653 RepID=A0A0K1PAD9_9BACT|nr:hemolysin family protein [Vulgatibacter incomptus]AKU90381.1 Magnesium and cobalt efflux protein CorC [Vulgatibacter incomptus]
METPWLGLGAALFLVFANGFFVATEFAIVKIRGTRLDELAKAGNRRAAAARRVVDRLDEYLSATQLGITLASLGLGWLGEPAFAQVIRPLLAPIGLSETGVHAVAIVLAFILITFLHIVLGELAPKSLAIQRPEGVSLAVAGPMKLFLFLFYPLIWALNSIAAAVLRVAGLETPKGGDLGHSEEELRLIISAMRATSGVPRERLDMLERTIRLPGKTARDLMVARGDIAFLRMDQTPEERRQIAVVSRHTRYPVVEEDLDQIAGILNLKDFFLRGEEPTSSAQLREVLREPLYVPESMRADILLREFRRKRQHLAIVVDEYGGTAGLVTVEDLVAAVLGELQDEFVTWGPSIVSLPSGAFAVDPTTSVDDFGDHFGLELDEHEVSTVGGLIMMRLDRIPLTGDRIQVGPIELVVEEMRGPKIVRVLAKRAAPAPALED